MGEISNIATRSIDINLAKWKQHQLEASKNRTILWKYTRKQKRKTFMQGPNEKNMTASTELHKFTLYLNKIGLNNEDIYSTKVPKHFTMFCANVSIWIIRSKQYMHNRRMWETFNNQEAENERQHNKPTTLKAYLETWNVLVSQENR